MITQAKRLMSNCALALVLAFLFTAPGAWASVTSGTLTISMSGERGYLECATLDWSTDVSSACVAQIGSIEGQIERIVILSDSGATSPVSPYTISLTDRDGFDMLGGAGVDVVSTITRELIPRDVWTFAATTMTLTGLYTTDTISLTGGFTSPALTITGYVEAQPITYPAQTFTRTVATTGTLLMSGPLDLQILNAGVNRGGIIRIQFRR